MSAVLAVLTRFWKDWSEVVFGVDPPDGGSGALKCSLVCRGPVRPGPLRAQAGSPALLGYLAAAAFLENDAAPPAGQKFRGAVWSQWETPTALPSPLRG